MAVKKLHTWIAVVGIAVLGAAAWWIQHRMATQGTAGSTASAVVSGVATAARGPGGPAAVEVGRVEAVRIEDDAQAVGSVRAVQTVTMRPEVSGRIVKLGFSDGQRVRRGQLLVQLDDTLQRAQLQQAQAQATIARTNLQRSRELQAQNFVSQSAVDQNAAALEVAEAQVALARAQLARLVVRAPFDGVAGIRSVNLGDYLKDGADMVNLEDRSRMWVDFRLPERYVGPVKAGLPVQVTLDAMPGRRFAGKVEALDAQVDANGRSLLVRARIDKPDAALTSGMFARVRIVFAVRERALMVPEEALVPQAGKQYIVKVIDGPAQAKLSQRIEARIGVRQAGKVEILEGLNPGDLVVTAGQARVMRGDGLPLRIVDLDRPGGAADVKRPDAAASGAASGVRAATPA
ncbi:MAG: efflux RND transporter periplasmic adaptor subunit [Burkholderiaceae bacterium]|nr:efflux RND transporter periplasmic adaptor subunit [Burkholderiaceae bacterium]